jgi:hypothetical protein
MLEAQVDAGPGHADASGPFASVNHAVPAEHRVVQRDLDDVTAEQRVEARAADQRGEQFQPVP